MFQTWVFTFIINVLFLLDRSQGRDRATPEETVLCALDPPASRNTYLSAVIIKRVHPVLSKTSSPLTAFGQLSEKDPLRQAAVIHTTDVASLPQPVVSNIVLERLHFCTLQEIHIPDLISFLTGQDPESLGVKSIKPGVLVLCASPRLRSVQTRCHHGGPVQKGLGLQADSGLLPHLLEFDYYLIIKIAVIFPQSVISNTSILTKHYLL